MEDQNYKISVLDKYNQLKEFDTDGYLYRLVWRDEFEKAKKCGYFLLNNNLNDANEIEWPAKCFFTSPIKLNHFCKHYEIPDTHFTKIKFPINNFDNKENLIFKFDVYSDGDLVIYYEMYNLLKKCDGNYGFIECKYALEVID
jgi:hypothetical protein